MKVQKNSSFSERRGNSKPEEWSETPYPQKKHLISFVIEVLLRKSLVRLENVFPQFQVGKDKLLQDEILELSM